jgi:PAS domain S-box-containing protein
MGQTFPAGNAAAGYTGAMDLSDKPTYDELEYRVRLLEREARWREEAQRTLKERESYLQILFEFAPDMYILCDARGRLIDANRASEKVTGYHRREVVGKDLFEAGIISGDQFEKGLNVFARVAAKIPTEPEEFIIRKKNGETLAVELRAYPVELQDQPIVLIIARDISRFRGHIDKLKLEGETFRTLFESDPAAVVIFDDSTGRIVQANNAARCLFGYHRGEIERMRIEDLCAPDTDTRSYAAEIRAAKSNSTQFGFRGFRTKTGDPVPARLLVYRLNAGGLTLTTVRIHQ